MSQSSAPSAATPALPAPSAQRSGKGWPWALLGLALTISGPFAYVMTINYPALRSSGVMMFVPVVAGALAALLGMARGGWLARGFGALALAGGAFLAIGFFVLGKLPPSAAPEIGDLAPEFTLVDSAGQTTSLREALATGPVWLVFYRGHW